MNPTVIPENDSVGSSITTGSLPFEFLPVDSAISCSIQLESPGVGELLSQKFQLFEGVFGASDEVLGAIESGIDFEKRILAIYQTCRNEEEIEQEDEKLVISDDDEIQIIPVIQAPVQIPVRKGKSKK